MSSTIWQNTLTTPIPADVDPSAIVKILHDHSYILSLNTIVTSHEKVKQEGPREIYNITESIPILPPIWKRSVTFQGSFENKDDGVWTWVTAPMGVNMHAKYVVRWKEEGLEGSGWALEEEIETRCSLLLKGFVERTMLGSHRNMHQRFIERARERGTGEGGEASRAL